MSDEAVGAYINDHFFSSYQKVGTFTIVNGKKQGGNAATYFCLPDGTVLNAIAGPVGAKEFLQEARWVVETHKGALIDPDEDAAFYFRRAHAERFRSHYAGARTKLPALRPANLPLEGQVQWLLAMKSSPKVNQVYKIVYEDILGERVSNLPVLEQ